MSDLTKALKDLHLALAEQLLARIASGDADASELKAAREFLKDNGYTDPNKGGPTAQLAETMPHVDPDRKYPFVTDEAQA